MTQHSDDMKTVVKRMCESRKKIVGKRTSARRSGSQNGGKKKSNILILLEPWWGDEGKVRHGVAETVADNLFSYACFGWLFEIQSCS